MRKRVWSGWIGALGLVACAGAPGLEEASAPAGAGTYERCFAEMPPVVKGRTWYAEASLGAGGSGTWSDPFRSLADAALRAEPGDRVEVLPAAIALSGRDLALTGFGREGAAKAVVVSFAKSKLSAAHPALRDHPAEAWEKAPSATGVTVFRTVRPMYELYDPAFLVRGEWGTTVHGLYATLARPERQLVPYPTRAELESPNDRFVPAVEDPAEGRADCHPYPEVCDAACAAAVRASRPAGLLFDERGCRKQALAIAPTYVGPGLHYDDWGCKRFLLEKGLVTMAQLRRPPADLLERPVDPDACHLYVRLDPGSAQRELRDAPRFGDDPRRSPLEIWLDESIVVARSRNVRIEGLSARAIHEVVLSDDVHHVDLAGLRVVASGSLEVVSSASRLGANGPDVHHVRITGGQLSNAFPEYVYWTDLKTPIDFARAGLPSRGGNPGPAARFHVPAVLIRAADNVARVDGEATSRVFAPACVAVERTIVLDTWFGVYFSGVDRGFALRNHVARAHDDGILYLSRGVADLEIAYNRVYDSLVGITQVPDGPAIVPGVDPTEGRVYVHHNVVDHAYGRLHEGARRFAIARVRPGVPETRFPFTAVEGDARDPYGFGASHAFAVQHSSGPRAAMHLYHNTFRTDGRDALGIPMSGERAYFANNVVVQLAPAGTVVVSASLSPSFAEGAGAYADGNVYARAEMGPDLPAREAVDCAAADPYAALPPMFTVRFDDEARPLEARDCGEDADCLASRCSARVLGSSGCAAPRWRAQSFRSLRDLWCGAPIARFERNVALYPDDRWVEVALFAEHAGDGELACVGAPCTSAPFANDRMLDPLLDARHVPAASVPVRVLLPAELPGASSPWAGACQGAGCPGVGP